MVFSSIQVITFPGVPPCIDTTSLRVSDFCNVLILDAILNLLISTITSLQRTAAAQADRLNFLTNWQQAYTDLLDQLHVFVANNGDYIEGSSTDEMNARDDLNRLNSAYSQQLQAQRSVVSDDAKGIQSNINASNNAVSQQANLASTILQQFSTILSSIFK